ncbi:DMT family transporter [Paenibacillus caui]|uniref:DMT family transporter n=1 Tax=Paenibacillus caui TaxID=2873927 RepID=UPI001CA93F75|nr:multidrug efflux SMR transporter [Paenibacillus caui]
MNRNWLYVLIGGIGEVVWVTGLKHASKRWEWLVTLVSIAFSFYLIIKASKRLPVGTVYAVFTGLGTAGTVIAEMLLFREPFQPVKILLIALLLSGVIGLKLITDSQKQEQEQEKVT